MVMGMTRLSRSISNFIEEIENYFGCGLNKEIDGELRN